MKHPKYYDAYIFKGKLLLKEKQWERALADFAIAAKLKPHKNLGTSFQKNSSIIYS